MRRWLLPLSYPWAAAAHVRAGLYARGLLAPRRLGRPTVSIGALEMGGTGKSPATAALARMLRDAGLRPGIVSRGYGRRSHRPRLVADGRRLVTEARDAGDEPYLYGLQLPTVPVAVAARREEAAGLLLDAVDVDVLLLDDAFQHLRVHRDVDLLVVDASAPFWTDATPPAGRLREGPAAAGRADAFLLSGDRDGECRGTLEDGFPGRPVFTLRARQPGAVPLLDAGDDPLPPLPRPALPFAGIARPRRFYESLERAGIDTVAPVSFRDHHWYTAGEIARLRESARQKGARCLLTTEKDAVRLPRDLEDPPIWVWRYRLEVGSPEALYEFLEPRLQRRPSVP